jgi:hypothetical protein
MPRGNKIIFTRFLSQMKKLSALFLMLLYLMPAVGFSVTTHYCGGKISSVSVSATPPEICVCGSKKLKSKCCESKIFTVKIKDTQQNPLQFSSQYKVVQSQAEIPFVQDFSFQFASDVNSFYYTHYPPDMLKQPLFVLHQVFRI